MKIIEVSYDPLSSTDMFSPICGFSATIRPTEDAPELDLPHLIITIRRLAVHQEFSFASFIHYPKRRPESSEPLGHRGQARLVLRPHHLKREISLSSALQQVTRFALQSPRLWWCDPRAPTAVQLLYLQLAEVCLAPQRVTSPSADELT